MPIHDEMFKRWKKYCHLLVHERGYRVEDVKTSGHAWEIARALEIPAEARHVDLSCTDADIDAALQKIFPNAVFGGED